MRAVRAEGEVTAAEREEESATAVATVEGAEEATARPF